MGFRDFAQVTENLTADDSDKIIAVPADEHWDVLGIFITLTSTATAGNRQLELQIRDTAGAIIFRTEFSEVQAASLTKRYAAAPNLAAEVPITAEQILEQIPRFILPSAYDIRVFDSAAIDAAADDMLVRVIHISHSNP